MVGAGVAAAGVVDGGVGVVVVGGVGVVVVGVSSQAAGHKTLVPQLINELRARGAGNVIVVCGGVIPPQDHAMLKAAGVAAIYGPGTNIPSAAKDVLARIHRRRKAA